jgi:hypothetical protein
MTWVELDLQDAVFELLIDDFNLTLRQDGLLRGMVVTRCSA